MTDTSIAKAYHAIHTRDKETILLKIGGQELENGMDKLIENIAHFVKEGLKFILVFGGGPQIDAKWNGSHTAPRQMMGGVGVTTHDVLKDAVIPAYEEIAGKLKALLPGIFIVPPSDVVCTQDEQYGLVGEVQSVQNIPLHEQPLIGVGFLGVEQGSGKLLNVNGDSLARELAEQFHEEIGQVMLLTAIKGVIDDTKKVRPLILSENLDAMLADTYPGITVRGGMAKKIAEIKQMLEHVSKVALTDIDGFPGELEKWRGEGTLFVRSDALSLQPLDAHSERIFDKVYKDHVASGIFRPRTPQEMETLKAHHRVLNVGGSPVGGYSLVPQNGGEYAELSVLWAGYEGNGLGTKLLTVAQSQAAQSGLAVYAISSQKRAGLFKRGSFEHHGTLKESKYVAFQDGVPEALESYKFTPGRNPPHLFTWKHALPQ
ncbi:MAG: hypothetical protein AAB588_04525 [Patescibacteria group bacterium]